MHFTDQFMKVLEVDAEERARRRMDNMAHADRLKQSGNAEFKEGRYEKAVEYYSEVSSL